MLESRKPPNTPEDISQLITLLIERIEILETENKTLMSKVIELESKLNLVKNSKNSTTSSTAPSNDLARSNTKNSRV